MKKLFPSVWILLVIGYLCWATASFGIGPGGYDYGDPSAPPPTLLSTPTPESAPEPVVEHHVQFPEGEPVYGPEVTDAMPSPVEESPSRFIITPVAVSYRQPQPAENPSPSRPSIVADPIRGGDIVIDPDVQLVVADTWGRGFDFTRAPGGHAPGENEIFRAGNSYYLVTSTGFVNVTRRVKLRRRGL